MKNVSRGIEEQTRATNQSVQSSEQMARVIEWVHLGAQEQACEYKVGW